MHIEKVQPRRRAPVAQQPRLHVVQRERPLQQRIVFQINLADGEIVGGAPVGIHLGQNFRAEGGLALRFLVAVDISDLVNGMLCALKN